ncbi:hypothetical protein F2P81_004619 [Scophthalmus maximus]|uniref:Uncharacterized protein n=1 Tax=Scophthalmus maximus TaxID=52904 RepID=A0A6A4TMR0_SCOMX|nr:hypothetical protein F2P81_004619 [Scophthalmus maximus]
MMGVKSCNQRPVIKAAANLQPAVVFTESSLVRSQRYKKTIKRYHCDILPFIKVTSYMISKTILAVCADLPI